MIIRPVTRPVVSALMVPVTAGPQSLGSDLRAQVISALFGASEQGALYDPSDLSTLYQDSAGTTPVTSDGDPVGRMEDLSGNGNHVTQTAGPNRPLYKTDGALHWLQFDGVVSTLVTAAYTISTANGYSAGAAAESSNVAATQHILDGDNTGGLRLAQLLRFSGSVFQSIAFDNGTTTDSDGASAMSNDTAYVGVTICNGTVLEVFRDASSNGSTALTGALDTGDEILAMGTKSPGTTSGPLAGKVYGAAHVDRGISASARGKLESWLAEKSGVTL